MKIRLECVVFGFADLAKLEAHLSGEQLFAQVRIVVQLGIHGGGDLVEDKAQAADEDVSRMNIRIGEVGSDLTP